MHLRDVVGFDSQTISALCKAGIETVEQLSKMRADEVAAIDGIGRKRLTVLMDIMYGIGWPIAPKRYMYRRKAAPR